MESDLLFYIGAEESWHPSKLNVMYLGSKVDQTMKFDSGAYSSHSHITFSATYKGIECESVDGLVFLTNKSTHHSLKLEINFMKSDDLIYFRGFCNRGNFPESGSSSDPLVVKSITLDPRGSGAWALSSSGKYWERNKYSFIGSYYYLYAKISDCEGHSKGFIMFVTLP